MPKMTMGGGDVMKKTPIKIAVVNYDKVLTSSLIGIIDIFAIVNTFCLDDKSKYYFETELLHVENSIHNFNLSVDLNSNPIDYKQHYDIVIVPPIIDVEFNFGDNHQLIKWLNIMNTKDTIICSVCVGAYILAQSGLLDNKHATSHWVVESKINHDFPKVKLDIDKIIVRDDNIITSGGASAYIYLCLYLVRTFISSDAAYMAANYLGVDAGKSSQLHYKDLAMISTDNDQDIEVLVDWIKKHLSQTITLKDMAKRISVSERTLIRKFKKSTGELPNNFIQKLRVQKAKELLINTNESFEQITYSVGYENPSTFRKLFKKITNVNPLDYRKLFLAA